MGGIGENGELRMADRGRRIGKNEDGRRKVSEDGEWRIEDGGRGQKSEIGADSALVE